jgi:hypothetical protein
MTMVPHSGALPKVFFIREPQQLLGKLAWEIRCLEMAYAEEGVPSVFGSYHLPAAYVAFNCAVTAWHISDWVWMTADSERLDQLDQWAGRQMSRASETKFQEALRERALPLKICYAIATGSKHLYPNRDKAPEVGAATEVLKIPFTAGSACGDPLMRYKLDLRVKYNGREAPADLVFRHALQFWRDFLKDLGWIPTSTSEVELFSTPELAAL